MAETTIEWTATVTPDGRRLPGFTFNPWVGCTKVSPACDHCYAEGWAKRTGQSALWRGERRRTSDANWRQPVKWNAKAVLDGLRRKVFCASLADVFDNQVPEGWRIALWALISGTPQLDWLLLTKRPQNIAKMLPPDWGGGWPNVWLGTTVENQEEADRRIPHLIEVAARVHFLSCEPLLGEIALKPWWIAKPHSNNIDWIICGGESGPKSRAMHPDWARSLRDQCAAAGVPFFFKQWGEWVTEMQSPEDIVLPGEARMPFGGPRDRAGWPTGDQTAVYKVGKKAAGALLDGREHREFPT